MADWLLEDGTELLLEDGTPWLLEGLGRHSAHHVDGDLLGGFTRHSAQATARIVVTGIHTAHVLVGSP